MLKSNISRLALLLSLGMTSPVLAQEAAAPAEGAAEAPAEAATTEAPAEKAAPKVGEAYLAGTFGAWEQRCIKTELSVDPCQLYMLLKDEDGTSVAEFSIFNLPEGAKGEAVAGATFIAPLQTLLTAGMRMTIDNGKPLVYPFTVCGNEGCVVRMGLTNAELASLKKGKTAVMTIVPFVAPDKEVNLEVSLKGFTAGYEAVEAQNKKSDAAAAEAAAKAEGN